MAFEFLIASYLLIHNVGGVIGLLPEFEKFGYKKLPKAVEEAVLIYLARTGKSHPAMSDYSVSNRTVESFRDFSSMVENAESMREKMNKVSKYRNTYWYYVLFSSPYAQKK